MKFFHILFLLSVSGYSQKNYFVIPEKGSIELVYKMGTDSFTDKFTSVKKMFEDKTYHVRIRTRTNRTDTALFREDDLNFYAATPGYTGEYIEIPKKPVAGQMWCNKDTSWIYTIKRIDVALRTPYKKYKKLVELEAKQVGKNQEVYRRYLNYYCKGTGFVASVADSKLLCYLYRRKIIK